MPFDLYGQDLTGCNCWTLVCLIYREVLGMELDTYAWQTSALTLDDRASIGVLVETEKSQWQRVKDRRAFDVVLFRIGGDSSHIGLYVWNNTVLHMLNGPQSVCESLNSFYLKDRIVGTYRHKARL